MNFHSANFLALVVLCTVSDPSMEAVGSSTSFHPAASAFPTWRPTRIDIRIDREGIESLRNAPRDDVDAFISFDQQSPVECRLHLKGTTTFRSLGEKPSLTIKRKQGLQLGGFSKLHLNNCVDDKSLLRDLAARAIFRRSGVPTPEDGHAVVFLNGHYKGVYSWAQGVNRDFLVEAFGDASGSLLEGDLIDLTMVSRQQLDDYSSRYVRRDLAFPVRIEQDNALAFLLGEFLAAHQDGAAFNCNNYWLYLPSGRSSYVLFPHTMDSAFRSRSMIGPAVRCVALVNYIGEGANRMHVISNISNAAIDTEFWNAFLRGYDIYASNLVCSLAPFEPGALLDRCRAVRTLRASIESNLRLLREACFLSKHEKPPPIASKTTLEWYSTQASVVVENSGSQLRLNSIPKKRTIELNASVILVPGKYSLEVDGPTLFGIRNRKTEFQIAIHGVQKRIQANGSTSESLSREFEVSSLGRASIFACREIQVKLYVTPMRNELTMNPRAIIIAPSL